MSGESPRLGSYEVRSEARRLWRRGSGDLVRLRTWDIFDRFLPATGSVADIGGGPGTHATYLAERGYDVTLIDPVERHIAEAEAAAAGRFKCRLGDARSLDVPDASFDVVVFQGPLYHLADHHDRVAALCEAHRVLRPNGVIIAEVMTRHAMLLDATMKGLISNEASGQDFDFTLETGMTINPDCASDQAFFAYLHRIEEIEPEMEEAGFLCSTLIGVEGPAWIMGNLANLVAQPAALLEVLRKIESEPSLLGVSGHVIAVSSRSDHPRRPGPAS